MWLDRVDILAEYDDWEVHSPSTSFKVPAVLLLRDYVKATRTVRFSRDNLLLRDEYKCQYCNADYQFQHDGLTYDHVVPRHLGGKTKWENIVAACQSCNLEKSHHMRMKPNNTPKRPTYFELIHKRLKFPVELAHESWNDYLGWDSNLVKIKKKRRG
jgi:5-methylcytosine-specific restriction endonuclease McrA